MKELKTIHGEIFLVDDQDYEKARQYKWRLKHGKNNRHQVITSTRIKDVYRKDISYKELILGLGSKMTLYKNNNFLDLRRENIMVFDNRREFSKVNVRINGEKWLNHDPVLLSKRKQGTKSKKRISKALYVGSYYEPKRTRPWIAIIIHNRKKYTLGSFTEEEHAAWAYDKKALELYGEDARRNFPNLTYEELTEKLAQITAKQIQIKSEYGLSFPDRLLKYRQNRRQKVELLKMSQSQYIGVYTCKGEKKWRAVLIHNNKEIRLGYYDSEEEAARVYDERAIELLGEDAELNFPRNNYTKELKTICGKTILFDDEDYEKAKQYRWTINHDRGRYQIVTHTGNLRGISYKKLILGIDKMTLFKNDNPLDLRRENIMVFDNRSEFVSAVGKIYKKKRTELNTKTSTATQGQRTHNKIRRD